ncbi:MAG: hypothetical protein IPN82_03185 [Chitinophagaceae bacterium]|nr:hypothetical protein [Chitinophagaceae bacterium]MBK8605854.1 hypothetical protein [Chitinophagaceae bacterium]MBP6476611.1 hypothetical protein [Chitinophagaceae bacterium]MBP7108231.1 hypothetical protein [Chitinophagaceae bacterium]MBP7314084.1 hypothetical protein [Chitinophagaceae bacterium]
MLTEGEKEFITYWEENRIQKKKVLRQLYVGLPMAVILIMAIFINFFSGWFKKADMALHREKSSLIIVLIVAALMIVIFIVIFSARHRWDMNEQSYRELISKRDKE